MYDNIGKTIKGLAKATAIIGAIAAIITGFIYMATDEDLIPTGFLIFITGPFVALISSFPLYGFGELIDKVIDIEKRIPSEREVLESKKTNTTPTQKEEVSNTSSNGICDSCKKYTKTTRVKLFDQSEVHYHFLCDDCIRKEKEKGGIITTYSA